MATRAKGPGRANGRRAPASTQAKPKLNASAKPEPNASATPEPNASAKPEPKPNAPAKPKAAAAPEAPATATAAPAAPPPGALRLAAAAQVIEAAGLCVAAVFGAISTADGKSSQAGSGLALTVFTVAIALGIALIAAALAKARPWSRTPVVMTQLLVVIGGIVLLDGHRPEWGVPALLLAVACLAGVLTPASLRALNRPPVKSQ